MKALKFEDNLPKGSHTKTAPDAFTHWDRDKMSNIFLDNIFKQGPIDNNCFR